MIETSSPPARGNKHPQRDGPSAPWPLSRFPLTDRHRRQELALARAERWVWPWKRHREINPVKIPNAPQRCGQRVCGIAPPPPYSSRFRAMALGERACRRAVPFEGCCISGVRRALIIHRPGAGPRLPRLRNGHASAKRPPLSVA